MAGGKQQPWNHRVSRPLGTPGASLHRSDWEQRAVLVESQRQPPGPASTRDDPSTGPELSFRTSANGHDSVRFQPPIFRDAILESCKSTASRYR
ncbi:hypothetical protein PAL_GLEAN10014631 [Pteropus alecto]|uniref:Uncharacterized protein n=1 Tax=Pteropus alecto TaxID=9402 RepID=L5KLW6_PTEAL|nr:hypothetical protein PAL_GLEAN10014631 [Pteropus alecto]